MRQTLFFIPSELAGFPLFGFGWLFVLWLVGSAIVLGYYVNKQGWSADTLGLLPFIGIVAAAIAFIMPNVLVDIMPYEANLQLWQTNIAAGSAPKGLPIRGYGVFLLIATVSGVALAIYRARKVGLSADAIFGLAFHMFVGGILGARLFFVIQNWDGIYDPDSIARTLGNMVNFVEGGLVVYGSLIGALAAGIFFLRKHRLPMLPIADLIAPSLALGLCIGRIGCLMNGCCYGGVCDQPWGITFPENSPPFLDQYRNGDFAGFRLNANEDGRPTVTRVNPGSEAEKAGLKVGMIVEQIYGTPVATMQEAQLELSNITPKVRRRPSGPHTLNIDTGVARISFPVKGPPTESLPTHPTQIYSSVNAALLCLLTLFWFPYRKRDGEVFAVLIAAYAVTRFTLEVIRTDEGAIGGTGMTISQNVSVAMLIGALALTAYLWRAPRGTSFWPQPAN